MQGEWARLQLEADRMSRLREEAEEALRELRPVQAAVQRYPEESLKLFELLGRVAEAQEQADVGIDLVVRQGDVVRVYQFKSPASGPEGAGDPSIGRPIREVYVEPLDGPGPHEEPSEEELDRLANAAVHEVRRELREGRKPERGPLAEAEIRDWEKRREERRRREGYEFP